MPRVRIERAEVRNGMLEIAGTVDGVPEALTIPVESVRGHARGEWQRVAAKALADSAAHRQGPHHTTPSEALPITGDVDVPE
jgi:hypothetical protein